jgi:hypothetical protein
VGEQLHLLHTSYEPASGLLGEASLLLNAALKGKPTGIIRTPGCGRTTRAASSC